MQRRHSPGGENIIHEDAARKLHLEQMELQLQPNSFLSPKWGEQINLQPQWLATQVYNSPVVYRLRRLNHSSPH